MTLFRMHVMMSAARFGKLVAAAPFRPRMPRPRLQARMLLRAGIATQTTSSSSPQPLQLINYEVMLRVLAVGVPRV